MRRGVDMGGHMHGGCDGLAEHAGLGHIVFAINLDVFEIGPVGTLEPVAVAEMLALY